MALAATDVFVSYQTHRMMEFAFDKRARGLLQRIDRNMADAAIGTDRLPLVVHVAAVVATEAAG